MDQFLIDRALKGNIIESLGLAPLSEEKRLGILSGLSDLIMRRLSVRIGEMMDDATQQEFANLLEAGFSDEMVGWLEKKGINFDELLLQEIARVKEDLAKRSLAIP